MDNLERLQKVMAQAGVASRRASEEIIKSGRVSVNGKIVKELGTKVSKKDIILVDGKPIIKENKVYYVLNKPTGYMTTLSDDLGRRTVMDLFNKEDLENRIYPIGRLDYDTSGVLLFTNDGELAYKLTKSAKEVEKSYQVRIKGKLSQGDIIKLMKGIELDGIKTKRSRVEVLSVDKVNDSSSIKLTITEGRNRQVRRMCEALGHEVKKLKRLSFAGITLEDLPEGAYRPLKPHEIKKLYSL